MITSQQRQRLVELWRALPARTRDRYAAWGFLGGIVAVAVVVAAASALRDDEPTPVIRAHPHWHTLAPEVARITVKVFPSATLRTDHEACRLLLAWARSRSSLYIDGVPSGDLNRAVNRCVAVGVWPSR